MLSLFRPPNLAPSTRGLSSEGKALHSLVRWPGQQALSFQISPDRLLVASWQTAVAPNPFPDDIGLAVILSADRRLQALGATTLSVLALVRGREDCARKLAAASPDLPFHLVVSLEHDGTDATAITAMALGTVEKEKLRTPAKARPGDHLVLTRPLGTGPELGALLQDPHDPVGIKPAMGPWLASMADVHAMAGLVDTSVLTAARTMAGASGVDIDIDLMRVPHAFANPAHRHRRPAVIRAVLDLLRRQNQGQTPPPDQRRLECLLLQLRELTGGLLVAVSAPVADALVHAFNRRAGREAAQVIGRVRPPRIPPATS